MDKQKAIKIAKQIKKDSSEIFPGNNDDLSLESNSNDNINQETIGEDQQFKQQIEQARQNDLAQSKKRIDELNFEIKKYADLRQQQMRERREQKEESKTEQDEKSLPMINSNPSRKGFWGRRIKSAQQQAQTETAAKRSSG